MKRFTYILIALALSLINCCQKAPHEAQCDTPPASNYLKGRMAVRVSESLAAQLEAGTAGLEIPGGAQATRMFAHGGIYEERMRRCGLHLWYDISFDPEVPLTRAGNDIGHVEGVEHVEYYPIITRVGSHAERSAREAQGEVEIFNDPLLARQWNLINSGNPLSGHAEGCDIGVAQAWGRGYTGSSGVTVAIIDSGIDFNHEDLAPNIWSGTDNAGKIIHGHNFITDGSDIEPCDHGTHIAGIIGAVNNNGKGVCGIAGGNDAAGIGGVKLMSCQILDAKGLGNGDAAAALVWAANNGAVIAQNSWAYDLNETPDMHDTPQFMKHAIDYFNTCAGCDNNGNQLPDSPMKGGVVFFAAGNEDNDVSYPSMYEGCIAVAAIAADYEPAFYTNHGTWVDIAAPGGDSRKGHMIYSTLPDDAYGDMQGTSMACPHASGVAALIASRFGGPGFTRDMLLERLLNTTRPLNTEIRVGGLLDASAALANYGTDKPNCPPIIKCTATSSHVVKIQAIVPPANADVSCHKMAVIYKQLEPRPTYGRQDSLFMDLSCFAPGDTVSMVINNLSANTLYRISVIGIDIFGGTSDISQSTEVRTLDWISPYITSLDGVGFLSVKKYETARFNFEITDRDEDLETVEYRPAGDFDRLVKVADDRYVLIIEGRRAAAGDYMSTIRATDRMNLETSYCVLFSVLENKAPKVKSYPNDVIFTALGQTTVIQLDKVFSDDSDDDLRYDITYGSDLVSCSFQGSRLMIKAAGYGYAPLQFSATDIEGKKAYASVNVLVRNGSVPVDLFPNPVMDNLCIRSTNDSEVHITVTSSSGATVIESHIKCGPFRLGYVNMASLPAGIYSVKATIDGKTLSQNIVKL